MDHTEEHEANIFAMELLIPEYLIREDMTKTEIDVDGLEIRKLALRYRVSEMIMVLRLVQLGYFKGWERE